MRGTEMKKSGVARRGALLSLILAGSLALSACGNANNNQPSGEPKAGGNTEAPAKQEVVTLKALMHTSWLKGGMEAILKESAEKAGVKLEIEKLPEGTDGENLIKTRFVTNDKPDLLFYYPAVTERNGLGKPEEQFVAQDEQPWIANFDKDVWKGTFDSEGTFYGIPYGGSNMAVMLYNKPVFEKLNLTVPTTMEQFWAATEAIKQAGIVPVYLSAKDAWTLQIPSLQAGAAQENMQEVTDKVFSNKGTMLDFTAKRQGITFTKEIVDKGLVNMDFLSDTYDNAQKALVNGEAGMYAMATWVMSDIVSKYPEKANDIGAFLIPFTDGANDMAGVFPPSSMYVVKGEKEEAAQKFANYFASIETQNLFFANEGGIPTLKGVVSPQLTVAEKETQQLVEAGKAGPVGVSPSAGITTHNAGDFPSYLQDLVAGVKTPEQVQEAEQKELEKNAKAKDDPNFK